MEPRDTPVPFQAMTDRLPDPLRRLADWVMERWIGRVLLGVMAGSRRVELFDRAMAIAAQVFTSVVPLVIAIASLVQPADAKDVTWSVLLPAEAESVVDDALTAPSEAAFGVIGVLLVILSATSLSRALARACAAMWDLERPLFRLAAAWRWLAAVMALVVALVAAKPLYRLSGRLPPPGLWELLAGLVPDIMVAVFIPSVLLARAVRVRLLLPGATVFAAVMLVVRPASAKYLPTALETSAHHYGSLGVAFTYLAWLYAVSWCFLVSGVLGRVLVTDPGRFGALLRGDTGLRQLLSGRRRSRRAPGAPPR